MKFRGLIATSLSGSLDGVVASHNAGGSYFRNRAIPVNPNSPAQQSVRSFFSQLQAAWSNVLTETQKEEWANYAAAISVSDAIGSQIFLQAKNWYTAGNLSRLRAGLDRVDDGPAVLALPVFTQPESLVADASADTLGFDVDPTDGWAAEDGGAMYVYASRPQSLSRNYFNGPYRLAGVVFGDGTTPISSTQTVDLPFPISAGQQVFYRFNVGRADGRQSPDFRGVIATS